MLIEDTQGTVLRIERSSIHDGAGLRTVLFLKGCPLDCHWCSTPESQQGSLEVGFMKERCDGCGACVAICPAGAISVSDGTVVRDDELCTKCFKCIGECPARALKGYGNRMTAREAVAEISKDEIFFFHSGGGVTLSGGECLHQPDFSAAILQLCRERGIGTAVETSLHAPWRSIEKIIPYVNDFYVDLKHPDSDEHRKFVGVDNSLILENLRKLDKSKYNFSLSIRIPLIPGINDGDSTLGRSVSMVRELTKLCEIELLPYHRLGVGSYEQLGRPYRLSGIVTPGAEYISGRAEFVRKLEPGVSVKIGGGYI